MLKCPNLKSQRWAVILAVFVTGNVVWAQDVILHLRNGDRIAGTIISENTNQVTVSTVWIKELSVPIAQIERREVPATNTVQTAKSTQPAPTSPALVPANVSTNKPVVTTAAAPATNAVTTAKSTNLVITASPPPSPKPSWFRRWKGDLSLGADLIFGAKDTQLYHGHLGLTYAQPYAHNPQKFFRNVITYNAEYGQTDGVLSANQMNGSSKTDFDLGKRTYVYNLAAIGYDEIRKIDIGYQIGPGFGYHLFTLTNFVMNVEVGGNYQAEYRSDNTKTENFYLRLANDLTWKINKQTTLVEKFELFPQVGNISQYRFRFESTLSHAILSNLSLNLTLLDLYDTRPAQGVPNNEVQIHSSLGLKF
jgi:putative salt-induced outer membrane protein YdiY